jgi:hypothetical protein
VCHGSKRAGSETSISRFPFRKNFCTGAINAFFGRSARGSSRLRIFVQRHDGRQATINRDQTVINQQSCGWTLPEKPSPIASSSLAAFSQTASKPSPISDPGRLVISSRTWKAPPTIRPDVGRVDIGNPAGPCAAYGRTWAIVPSSIFSRPAERPRRNVTGATRGCRTLCRLSFFQSRRSR